MQERLVIESINFDYIPGEPESRRVWYITLRQPPFSIKPGNIIRIDSFRGTNIPVSYETTYFRTHDIYGRYVIVEPIVQTELLNSPYKNYRTGIYSYAQRPQTQVGPNSYFDIMKNY